MKRVFLLSLALAMCVSLCACGGGGGDSASSSGAKSNSSTSGSKQSSTDSSGSIQIGTRSNPYQFGDEIAIDAKSLSADYTVKYILKLNEFWGSDKVAGEYPDYVIQDRILIRASLSVTCDETDDEIHFDLYPSFITDSLNEENAQIETYKAGELSNSLYSVYSGGNYDIIIMGSDGSASFTIPYLKISYYNADGESTNIWISIPEQATSDAPEGDSSSVTGANDNSSTEAVPQMTSEELEKALLEEPMYVEKTDYIVQSPQYKALYPDMLQAVIKNNSGTDVKNAVVAFVAWDSNGFPVKIEGQYSLGQGSYVAKCNYPDANMVNGAIYGQDGGYSLAETNNIATFKAIVVSYDDFDGNTWNNPYYDTWETLYANQKLS